MRAGRRIGDSRSSRRLNPRSPDGYFRVENLFLVGDPSDTFCSFNLQMERNAMDRSARAGTRSVVWSRLSGLRVSFSRYALRGEYAG